MRKIFIAALSAVALLMGVGGASLADASTLIPTSTTVNGVAPITCSPEEDSCELGFTANGGNGYIMLRTGPDVHSIWIRASLVPGWNNTQTPPITCKYSNSCVVDFVNNAGNTDYYRARQTSQPNGPWVRLSLVNGAKQLSAAGVAYAMPSAKPTPMVAKTTSCFAAPDGKCYWYNGYHFSPTDNPQICLQNNIGTYWDIPTAAAGFVSGSSTVGLVNRRVDYTASCSASGYPGSRIINLTTYNAADSSCYKVTGDNNNGQWTNLVVIWMNLSSQTHSCRDTVQQRNNNISSAIGGTLGLSLFSSSTNLTAAIMNNYFRTSYNWPGSDDRNALYWLY